MSTNEDKLDIKLVKDKFIITKKSTKVDGKFIEDLVQKTILKQNDVGSDTNEFIKKVIVEADQISSSPKLFPPDKFFEITWQDIPKTEVFYYVPYEDSKNQLDAKETLRTLVNNRMFRYPMTPESLTINQLNLTIRSDRWYSKVGAVQLKTPSSQNKMFRKGAPDSKNFSLPSHSSYCLFGQMDVKSNVICTFASQDGDFSSLKMSLSLAFSVFNKRKDDKVENQIVLLKSVKKWEGFENALDDEDFEYWAFVHELSAFYETKNVSFVESVDKMFENDTNNNVHRWIIFPWNNKSWVYHDDSSLLLFNVVFNGGKEQWTSLDIVDSIYEKLESYPIYDGNLALTLIGSREWFLTSTMKLANHKSRAWNWKQLPVGYQNLPSYETFMPIYQKITTQSESRKWNIGDFWVDQLDPQKIPLFYKIIDSNSSGFGSFLIITNEASDIFYPRRFWNQFARIIVNNTKETEIYILPAETEKGAFPLSQSIENVLYAFIDTDINRFGEKWSKVRVEYFKLFQVMWLSTFMLTIQLRKVNIDKNRELMKTWDKNSGQPQPNVLGAEVAYLYNFLRSTSFKFWLMMNNLLNDNLYFEFAQWDDIPLSFAAAGGIVDFLQEDFYLSSKMMIFTSRLLNVLLTNVYVAPLKRKYFKSDKSIPESEMALYASKEIKTNEEYLCTYMGIRVASEFTVKEEVNSDEKTAIICPKIVKTELLSQSSYTVGLQSYATKILSNGCLAINTERIIPSDSLLITKLELVQRAISVIFVDRKTPDTQTKNKVSDYLTQLLNTKSDKEIKDEVFKYFPYLSIDQMKVIYPILPMSESEIQKLNELLPIRLPTQSELKKADDFKLWFSPFLANMTFDIWNPYLLGGDHMASVGKFANGAVTEQIKNDLGRQIPSAKSKIDDWLIIKPNAEFVIYEMDPLDSKFQNDYYLSSIHSTSVFLEQNIKPRMKTESLLQPIMQGMEIITPTDFMSKIQIQFIKSTKSLKPDEEVIIDYGSEYWVNIDTPFGKKNLIDTFDSSRSIFSIYNYYFLLSNVSRNIIKSDKHTTDYLFLDKDLTLKKPETLAEINSRVANLSVIWDNVDLPSFKPDDIDEWFSELEKRLGLPVLFGRKNVSNLATRLVKIEKASGLKNSQELDADLFEDENKNANSSSSLLPKNRKELTERVNNLVESLQLNFVNLSSKSKNEDVGKVLTEIEKFLKISEKKQDLIGDRNSFNNLLERVVFDEMEAQKYLPAKTIQEWIKRAYFVGFRLKTPLTISSDSDITTMNNWLSLIDNKLSISTINIDPNFKNMAKRLSNIEIVLDNTTSVSPKIVKSLMLVLKSPNAKINHNLSEIQQLKLDPQDELNKLKIDYLGKENEILKGFEMLKNDFSDSSLNNKLGQSLTVDQILHDAMKKQIELLHQWNLLIDEFLQKSARLQTNDAADFNLQLKDDNQSNLALMSKIYSTSLSQRVMSLYQLQNLPIPTLTKLREIVIEILIKLT
jgi:hypothetical protein